MMNNIWKRIEVTEMTDLGICIAKPKIYLPKSSTVKDRYEIILSANSREAFEEKLCDVIGKEEVQVGVVCFSRLRI